MRINFDMDGTIANLYGVEGWLDMIINEDATPYAMAKPLVNLQALAHRLNNLQKKGHEIAIITWLAKGATAEYDEKVATAKIEWLKQHLASVKFDEIHIVKYGTPKHEVTNGILFDDEKPNRDGWGEGAYTEKEIFTILGGLN
jgi:hypothetical protein